MYENILYGNVTKIILFYIKGNFFYIKGHEN